MNPRVLLTRAERSSESRAARNRRLSPSLMERCAGTPRVPAQFCLGRSDLSVSLLGQTGALALRVRGGGNRLDETAQRHVSTSAAAAGVPARGARGERPPAAPPGQDGGVPAGDSPPAPSPPPAPP